MLRDPATGFFTMAALHEFIRYEIDGGAQTERHEQFVTPVCVVAIAVDGVGSVPHRAAQESLLDVTGRAIGQFTRRSDRLARHGDDFVALLRRTLAKRAREFYAPHLTAAVAEATREAGCPTTLSFGIVSLTEHLVRDPDDMLRKAFVALGSAKQQGPGSITVYDLRQMG
jgi:GGDEF domain-containing protein